MQLVLALVVLPPDFLGLPAFRLLAQPPTVDKGFADEAVHGALRVEDVTR